MYYFILTDHFKGKPEELDDFWMLLHGMPLSEFSFIYFIVFLNL